MSGWQDALRARATSASRRPAVEPRDQRLSHPPMPGVVFDDDAPIAAELSPPHWAVTLPLPPSDNAINRCRGVYLGVDPTGKPRVRGQMYKTEAWKAYASDVVTLLKGRSPCYRWPQMLEVGVRFTMPRAGSDTPNRLKALFDALEGLIFEDDEQVARLAYVERLVDPKAPGVYLEVRPIDVDRYGRPLLGDVR